MRFMRMVIRWTQEHAVEVVAMAAVMAPFAVLWLR